MGTESSSTSGAPKNVSRRRVVAGAAWAVPAVMVASAAPAVAASQCLIASFGGNSCKFPGSNNRFGYKLELCFTNNCTTQVTVHIISVESTTGQVTTLNVNRDIVVPATGEPYCDPTLVYFCSTNSANFIAVRYSIAGTEYVDTLPSPVQTCVGSTPSCQN